MKNEEFEKFTKKIEENNEAWREWATQVVNSLHSQPSELTMTMFKEIKEALNSLDKKFAPKWTGDIVKLAVIGILVFFGGSVIAVIATQPQ